MISREKRRKVAEAMPEISDAINYCRGNDKMPVTIICPWFMTGSFMNYYGVVDTVISWPHNDRVEVFSISRAVSIAIK